MLEDGGFNSVENLVRAVDGVQSSLEAEQEKLAGVVKSLACGGGRSEGVRSGGVEEVEVSKEWLDSLRERKKVYQYFKLVVETSAQAGHEQQTQCSFTAENEDHLITWGRGEDWEQEEETEQRGHVWNGR